MRTLLICHEEDELNRVGLAAWMASFSHLEGMVVLRETPDRKRKRVRREIQRVGWLRFWTSSSFALTTSFSSPPRIECGNSRRSRRFAPSIRNPKPQSSIASTPNTREAEKFIRDAQPDLVIARCKTLIAERIFTIPTVGTFVMHPGICPEYRNAHGCFWAVANADVERIGMTLLKIDKGVDTGAVYGYFYARLRHDESHIVLQHRTVFDNLDAIGATLRQIGSGAAPSIDTTGRRSAEWGQPWMTRYFAWQRVLRSLA